MLEFIEYLHKGPKKRFNAKPGFRLYLISGNVELGIHKSFHVGVFLGYLLGIHGTPPAYCMSLVCLKMVYPSGKLT